MFSSMAYSKAQLFELDLSSFNTSQVTIMDKMFYNNRKIRKIYVGSNWNTDNVTSSANMVIG